MYSWSWLKVLKSAISWLFSLTGQIGTSSTSLSSITISQSEGTYLTSVHVHSLDIPNRHQHHHPEWPIFQILGNLSFRAQGAMGSHTPFSEKLALVKSCILGAKWFVVISFWPAKNWWTERRKDIKINIKRIAKAASHKLPGYSRLNVNFLCPVCPTLFVQHMTFYL